MKILLLAALTAALAAPARALDVEWGPIKAGGYSSGIRVPGRVVAQEGALSIESARVQGRVVKILRREGERVSAGDALFAIASPECLSLANERQAARSRGLAELIEAADRRAEQLGLSVGQAPTDCRVLASHDGTLAKRQVELGAAFNVGDALATILDVSRLGVELDVPERNLGEIHPGQKVRVELAAAPGRPLSASVDSLLPTIDPATRSGRARLTAPALPPGTTLDALVFAEVDTGVKQRAFKVPTTAIVFSRNRQYLVKKAGREPVAVAVDVLGESESSATVRPSAGQSLRLGDEVAVKGAIYLLKKLGDS